MGASARLRTQSHDVPLEIGTMSCVKADFASLVYFRHVYFLPYCTERVTHSASYSLLRGLRRLVLGMPLHLARRTTGRLEYANPHAKLAVAAAVLIKYALKSRVHFCA